MGWNELYRRAASQRGVITRADPVECGVDLDTYEHRVRSEKWDAPYRGVRLLPGTTWGPDVMHMAAMLSVKQPVALDRWSAAWALGVRRNAPSRPMLAVPRNRRPAPKRAVVRRTTHWRDEDFMMLKGFCVPVPAKLVTDIANQGHPDRTVIDLAFALKLRHGLSRTAILQMADEFVRHSDRELLRRIADMLSADGAESGLEQLVRRRLLDAGFEPDLEQLTIRTRDGNRRLDIVWRHLAVGIEVNSTAYHGDEDAMSRDAEKRNAVTSDRRWVILVLTPQMLVGAAWDRFLADLRLALTTGAAER